MTLSILWSTRIDYVETRDPSMNEDTSEENRMKRLILEETSRLRERESVVVRVVEVMPLETWANPPEEYDGNHFQPRD